MLFCFKREARKQKSPFLTKVNQKTEAGVDGNDITEMKNAIFRK